MRKSPYKSGLFSSERVLYAGMPVPKIRRGWHKLFAKTRERYSDIPTYEAALLFGLRERCETGNHVVVVGAGLGVTVTAAAKAVGPTGSVTCFEGSSRCLKDTKETLELNGIVAGTKLIHAIVGEAISVYKTDDIAMTVPASELPECDVLELDCEGAEIKILSQMTIRPNTIVVETHGTHGAPTFVVSDLLENLGYTVVELGVAEPNLEEYCIDKDIMVLLGTR